MSICLHCGREKGPKHLGQGLCLIYRADKRKKVLFMSAAVFLFALGVVSDRLVHRGREVPNFRVAADGTLEVTEGPMKVQDVLSVLKECQRVIYSEKSF